MDSKHSDQEKREQIVQAGWRQGSLFRLPPRVVPENIGYDPENELLILATQSCTVVSPSFERDPWIEVMVAYPRAEYNEKTDKARGRNVRAFTLPLLTGSLPAVECDLNRRFFLERQGLVGCEPLGDLVISDKARRAFAGWIARSYIRIALPDALVDRLEPLLEKIKKILKRNPDAKGPLHERILHVYINWSPLGELTSVDTPYEIALLFLCEEGETLDHLDRELLRIPVEASPGIRCAMKAQVTSETFVADLDPYVRLSEWDYLSNLGELGDHPLGM